MSDFGYFYGVEAEQFAFYRIPRLLIKDARFKGLSNDAKLLYGLMLDRMSLSMKNEWLDEENKAYIIYPLDAVMEDLACCYTKAVNVLAELDSNKGIGLIERVRRGLGKPDIIYVKKFSSVEENSESIDNSLNDVKEANEQCLENQVSGSMEIKHQEIETSDIKKYENQTSRNSKIKFQEIGKSNTNYINNNNTDMNYININNNITPKSENFEEQPTGQVRLDYERIVDMYNSTCKDLPKVRGLSDERRRKIKTLLGNLKKAKLLSELDDYEKLQYIFRLADESDFLSGRDAPNGWCGFDWLIQSKNTLKVIEGNYRNKGGAVRHGGAINQTDASGSVGAYTSESENEALAAFRAGKNNSLS